MAGSDTDKMVRLQSSEKGEDDQLRPDEEDGILFGLELQGGEEDVPSGMEIILWAKAGINDTCFLR